MYDGMMAHIGMDVYVQLYRVLYTYGYRLADPWGASTGVAWVPPVIVAVYCMYCNWRDRMCDYGLYNKHVSWRRKHNSKTQAISYSSI